jgi:hypothetical protein
VTVSVGDDEDAAPEHSATYEMVLGPGVFERVNGIVVVFAGTGLAGVKLDPLLDVTVKPVSVDWLGQLLYPGMPSDTVDPAAPLEGPVRVAGAGGVGKSP